METIAAVASNTIWGTPESKEEPVSGKKGDVSKGEPYDFGNVEHGEYPREQTRTVPIVVKSDTIAPRTNESDLESTDSKPTDLTSDTDHKPDTTHRPDSGLKPEFNASKENPAKITASTADSQKAPESDTPKANPAEIKDSSTTTGDSTKGQNDVRDPSEPDTHSESSKPKTNVDNTTGGPEVGENPTKDLGPGPRPLEVVAKEHGGDASAVSTGRSVADNKDDNKDEHHESGTDELYVKSSGLVADGGDFDAAKPGAGREADRILESKGGHKADHHPVGGAVDDNKLKSSLSNGSSGSGADPAAKEKTSLKTKLKDKLHIHSHSAKS